MQAMSVPAIIYLGTTLAAEIVSNEYPPDTWTGELRFSRTGLADVIFQQDGPGAYTFSGSTAALSTGNYTWSLVVTDGSNTQVAATGSTVAKAIGTATDLQQAKDTLVDVRAALAEAAGQTSSYSIKDRSLTRRTVAELLQLEGYWMRRVNELQAAADAVCPTKTGNRRITYGTFMQ